LGAGPLTKPSAEFLLTGIKHGTPHQKWKTRIIPEQQEYPTVVTKYEQRPETLKKHVRDFFKPKLRRIELFSTNATEGFDSWGLPYGGFFMENTKQGDILPLDIPVGLKKRRRTKKCVVE